MYGETVCNAAEAEVRSLKLRPEYYSFLLEDDFIYFDGSKSLVAHIQKEAWQYRATVIADFSKYAKLCFQLEGKDESEILSNHEQLLRAKMYIEASLEFFIANVNNAKKIC